MLEHEAHKFGLRDKALPPLDMDSPQQIQMRTVVIPVKSPSRSSFSRLKIVSLGGLLSARKH